MTYELRKYGTCLSPNTFYKHTKTLKLRSIIRTKYAYKNVNTHKIFNNILNQNFIASKPNEKWCTDFTYLQLSCGQKLYNCSILDLYDRSIVASVTSDKVDANLAIKTLQTALNCTKFVAKIA